jgi:hypothetical protein
MATKSKTQGQTEVTKPEVVKQEVVMNNKQAEVQEVVRPEAQRLDLQLVDLKIRDHAFETKVQFVPVYSKKNDKWYLKISFGGSLERTIFVSARKDGKGVCVLTDWERFQYRKSMDVVAEPI